MLRILIATLLGAIAFFIWGALAWTVLQIHSDTMHPIENEDAVMQTLAAHIGEPGVYYFPELSDAPDGATDEQAADLTEAWKERHRQGPVGLIVYREGSEPMPPQTFGIGFAINAIMALLASTLLAAASGSVRWYPVRVLFVILIGAIVAASSHLMNWNWMGFPVEYIRMQVIDTLIGWSIAGVLIAAVIKPRVPAS